MQTKAPTKIITNIRYLILDVDNILEKERTEKISFSMCSWDALFFLLQGSPHSYRGIAVLDMAHLHLLKI